MTGMALSTGFASTSKSEFLADRLTGRLDTLCSHIEYSTEFILKIRDRPVGFFDKSYIQIVCIMQNLNGVIRMRKIYKFIGVYQ